MQDTCECRLVLSITAVTTMICVPFKCEICVSTSLSIRTENDDVRECKSDIFVCESGPGQLEVREVVGVCVYVYVT